MCNLCGYIPLCYHQLGGQNEIVLRPALQRRERDAGTRRRGSGWRVRGGAGGEKGGEGERREGERREDRKQH